MPLPLHCELSLRNYFRARGDQEGQGHEDVLIVSKEHETTAPDDDVAKEVNGEALEQKPTEIVDDDHHDE